jgi:hypothetical protein
VALARARLGALSAALRGEKSRCNHGAIMIRLVSRHWNSASDALVSGQYALTASERGAGRLSAAPSVSNQDVIMIQVVEPSLALYWRSASDALVAGGWRSWRVIIMLGPPLGIPSESNHDAIMMPS